MVSINEEEYIKLIGSFEKICLEGSGAIKRNAIRKNEGRLLMVKDAERGYFIGRVTYDKEDCFRYSIEANGIEKTLLYKDLRELYILPPS
ncbi:hypothetical protein DRN69_01385 [Candidatus Pacearchaeota archaeon]|nr:MAG: hypothetical protein DRN69_01385 [Candidatus Pacearchaeota archaeon]